MESIAKVSKFEGDEEVLSNDEDNADQNSEIVNDDTTFEDTKNSDKNTQEEDEK